MVSWSLQKKYAKPMVAGVTFISDAYPNVKYKINHLEQNNHFYLNVYDLFSSGNNKSFWKSKQLSLFIRFVIYTLNCFFRTVKYRPDIVYLPYPGIFLSVLLFIVPKKYRPAIYLDSFISLYDTVVIDRKLLGTNQYLAKILYTVERLSYRISTTVITDTFESSVYLSKLYRIPLKKFKCCTLTQTPVILRKEKCYPDNILKCLFVGTFVPLQGVEIIAEAVTKIKDDDNITITLIGDGQTALNVENILKSANSENYIWEKGWMPMNKLAKEIQKADLCLGIFGNTDKTDRVWPFKNYLYLSCGCPLITKKTPCAESLKRMDDKVPIYFPKENTANALIELLKDISRNKNTLMTKKKGAMEFYTKYLSNQIAYRQIDEILAGS